MGRSVAWGGQHLLGKSTCLPITPHGSPSPARSSRLRQRRTSGNLTQEYRCPHHGRELSRRFSLGPRPRRSTRLTESLVQLYGRLGLGHRRSPVQGLVRSIHHQIDAAARRNSSLHTQVAQQRALLRGEAQGKAAVDGDRGVVPARAPSVAPSFPRNTTAPYAHPYYWAPFFLMGNWL